MTKAENPPSYPLDHLALRGATDAPALLTGDAPMSFADLDAGVGRLAAWLRAAGARPGDRVASWSAKTRAACLMPLAAARAGLIHVPVNPLLKAPQVAHILADSGAALLLTNRARADMLGDGLPGGCALRDLTAVEAAIDGHPERLPPSAGDPGDLVAILYTSGSTGRPKGVMLSHANLWLGAESVATYLALGADDRVLAVLPFSFDYGQNRLSGAAGCGEGGGAARRDDARRGAALMGATGRGRLAGGCRRIAAPPYQQRRRTDAVADRRDARDFC